jgi:acyl-CoA synthetase (AMP-forming)/AMP-acid ligase II
MPMGDILRRSAHRSPQKTAFIFGRYSVPYEELNQRVNRLANRLLDLGLRKGNRVAVILHNSPEFYEAYFACAKTGAIFVPVNNLLKKSELQQILSYLDPEFLFFDREYLDLIRSFERSLNFGGIVVGAGDATEPGLTKYESLLDQGEPDEPIVAVSDEDIMSIFLTSGTTGLPKGAMRTHQHVFVNALVGAIEVGLRYDDRVLMVFPFYHVTWEDNMRHILMANTIVIRREGSFNSREVLGMLERERITVCQLVPTMISTLLQEESFEKYDLSDFRLLIYAASPIPTELLRKAMKKFECQFLQFYGQTETGPLITVLRPEDHVLEGSEAQLARISSAGRPVLNYEVRLVNDSGDDVIAGEVGEIVCLSESMTIGYWNLPEETSKVIRGGWLHTGDYGRLDEEGYVYIVDRKNDMIISGGKNIYPREIEEVLYRHEAVLEASVIGVPDEHWGEAVKALVVLKEGRQASEEGIIGFCKENLASYKKPRSVEFRRELPKNPTGKILKRLIREEYWKGRDRKI